LVFLGVCVLVVVVFGFCGGVVVGFGGCVLWCCGVCFLVVFFCVVLGRGGVLGFGGSVFLLRLRVRVLSRA
ncbi:hypothetical protein, partial [Pseudomonas syringae group genomosp. 7]|uniref:hypothetical protein n=1 Tax=Pseudomonas syringae group genomosp. 7 TaxID=251699 RepID=UPI00376F9230